VHVYLKDESVHPTGSRKHRLARSLFLYAVVNGQIATGANLWGVCLLAARLLAEGRRASIVSLICDCGERYRHSYDDDAWLAAQGLELAPYTEILHRFAATCAWPAAQT
jgi:cysteine synthase